MEIMVIKRIISSNSEGHIPELDGLRGIAISCVVLFHVFSSFKIFSFGWIGVDLFFVLSGFLITKILYQNRGRRGYFKIFIIRRTLRIFPLYFLIIFSFLFLFVIFELEIVKSVFTHKSYYLTYTQNLIYFKIGHFIKGNILNHFWSLSVEEHFYLFWPFIVLYLPKKFLIGTSLILIVTSKVLAAFLVYIQFSPVVIYTFTLTRIDALILGGLLAIMYAQNMKILESSERMFKILIFTLFLMGMIVLESILNGSSGFWDSLRPMILIERSYGLILFLNGIAFSVLVIISMNHGRLKKHLQNKYLGLLGRYSYGLYVYHAPIYLGMNYLLSRDVTKLPFNMWHFNLLYLSFICVFSIAVAAFSYHYYELRFLKYKSKWT